MDVRTDERHDLAYWTGLLEEPFVEVPADDGRTARLFRDGSWVLWP